MSRKRLRDEEIRMMFDDSDSEDDLEELNGDDGGWIDADREVIDGEREVIDEEDAEDSDGEVDGDGDDRRRPKKVKKRIVNCLDAALDLNNYDPMDLPTVRVEHSAELVKATRNDPAETITWVNQKPIVRGRQGRENVIRTEGGVTDYSRNAKTESDCFKLFFSDDVVDKLVTYTNKNIINWFANLTETGDLSKKNWINETDKTELLAYLGLCYLRACYKQNHWTTKRIFQEGVGLPIFEATMSRNRFDFLSSHFCMDDPDTRPDRFKTDRFAAAREVFELFNDNCSLSLQCDDYLCIDECLYQARTQFSFKQYNKSKPAKYGLLVKCLNTVRYPFTLRSDAYAGKPIEPGPYHTSSVQEVTLKLVDDYKNHGNKDIVGRNITTDNLYTSIPLAQEFLDRGVTLVGTVRSNRKGVPAAIKSLENREDKSSTVWWDKDRGKLSITSYVALTKSKGLKNIIILSSTPPLLGVTKDDDKQKPAIFKLYDFTKSGTDIVDQRSESNSTNSKSRKWTKKVLFFMLDVSRVNAQTIWSLNNDKIPRKVDSWEFGWKLGYSLVKPYMEQRLENPSIRKDIKVNIKSLLKIDPASDVVIAPNVEGGSVLVAQCDKVSDGPRSRCSICYENLPHIGHKAAKDKLGKYKSKCQLCTKFVCGDHSFLMCNQCKDKVRKVDEVAQIDPDGVYM